MHTSAAEIVVLGAGLAGLSAALALAETGAEVKLVGLTPPAADNRTTALLGGAVFALRRLGVWPGIEAGAGPLRTLRLIDDTGSLIRAPEIAFAAQELGLEAFGWNVVNRDLIAALRARAHAHPCVDIFEVEVSAVEATEDGVVLRTAAGDIATRLLVGADGRRSMARAAAGLTMTHRAYPQTAVTLNLSHVLPHGDVSTEFHTRRGPFTLVPLPGARSSLVCVTAPDDAERLMAMDDSALAQVLERRAHFLLGAFRVVGSRAAWPLAMEMASPLAARRVALVGDAGHVVPPIGAQGFNLGFRDAATLAEIVGEARRAGDDVGDERVLRSYDRARRADIVSRATAIDLLNRSLLSPYLPFHAARGLALLAIDRVPGLRRLVMRAGLEPPSAVPALMRPEPG